MANSSAGVTCAGMCDWMDMGHGEWETWPGLGVGLESGMALGAGVRKRRRVWVHVWQQAAMYNNLSLDIVTFCLHFRMFVRSY